MSCFLKINSLMVSNWRNLLYHMKASLKRNRHEEGQGQGEEEQLAVVQGTYIYYISLFLFTACLYNTGIFCTRFLSLHYHCTLENVKCPSGSKQHTKNSKFTYLSFFASFDTHGMPRGKIYCFTFLWNSSIVGPSSYFFNLLSSKTCRGIL